MADVGCREEGEGDVTTEKRENKRKEANMSNRKLVMEEHGGKVLVGMQQEDCDPIVKTVEGDLYDALGQVNGLLAAAQEQWATEPKNPAYKPPATPKPTAAPAKKTDELPLLAGKAGEKAEEAAPAPAPSTEAPTEAEPVAAEETTGETKEEAAEAQAAPAEPEPEPEGPPAEPEPSPEPAEEKAEAAPVGVGYYLKDGRGPYADIQAAIDEMGIDKENRPHHNRWDRLSTTLKEQIIRRPKA